MVKENNSKNKTVCRREEYLLRAGRKVGNKLTEGKDKIKNKFNKERNYVNKKIDNIGSNITRKKNNFT